MLKSILDFLTTPSNAFVILVVLGLALLVARWRRSGLTCSVVGVLGLLMFGYFSVSDVLMAPLVSRFPPVPLDAMPIPHGIIIMGDGVNEAYAQHTGALLELTESGDAVPIAALLAQRYPQARIIISSGSALPGRDGPAFGIKRILLEFGVASNRISLDAASLNTRERVRNSIELMGDDRDQVWWVVTSAHRMPRVMGVFRAMGVQPYPYPVDFRWTPPFALFYPYPLTHGLRLTDVAADEWKGLAFYWYRGHTSAFFPAPATAPLPR